MLNFKYEIIFDVKSFSLALRTFSILFSFHYYQLMAVLYHCTDIQTEMPTHGGAVLIRNTVTVHSYIKKYYQILPRSSWY